MDGERLGVIPIKQALKIAMEKGLDLFGLTARPPVCRIMDYGKYRFEQSKENGKEESRVISVKEIKLRLILKSMIL